MMSKKLVKFIGLGLGIAFTMALFVNWGVFMGFQLALQNKFYDYASASPDIVVVAIDEKSLLAENLGPLQKWKRETYAKAINILNEKGAAAIGIDVTFPDDSIHGKADDETFRDAIKAHPNVVLAGRYFFNGNLAQAEWPNETLLEANPKIGWINVALDADGFVRQIPVVNAVKDKNTEAFSLELARITLDAASSKPQVREGLYHFSPSISIPVQTHRDPASNKDIHMMYVNYFAEPGGFSRISMSDLLQGKIMDGKGKTLDLRNKIVLIGPTALDLQDTYLSPVSEGVRMPGVEIHANNLQTIIEGEFLRDQSAPSLWATLALILLINLFVFSRLRVRFAIPLFVLEMFGVVVAGIVGYESRVFLNVVYPILLILMTFVGTFIVRYLIEQSGRKFVEGALGHYVNRSVVDQILKNPSLLKLGGERRDISVFFSDIAGFTSISEKMGPQELVGFLNGYLGEMTQVILARGGTLDKYEGDAIMAFWGAPIDVPDHAKQACLTALENQRKLETLRAGWKQKGLPPFHVRIGLNTGDAVVGNMGSESRFNYTAMGDNVNLASRLEGINKQYGTEICLSEATHELVKNDFVCRELDLIRVKGKETPVRIFELIAEAGQADAETTAKLEKFAKALIAYRLKSFEPALGLFRSIPNDPPSEAFAKRCEEFLKNPPPENWDGVWTFNEK